eukprot:TRINITY_DN14784_c0_g1_i1.p1 TRINITY_DN14784_c0_g1~~TRINITY_DN14784_c0_g1_i1.p1  ORF type:complete len:200 (-),score=33.92 TRINITY_DN14784_c0_g1_i1:16-615(-)
MSQPQNQPLETTSNHQSPASTPTHGKKENEKKSVDAVRSMLDVGGKSGSSQALLDAMRNCRGCVKAIERDVKRLEAKQQSSESPVEDENATEEPPSLGDLGRSTWTLIHTVAAAYPTKPEEAEKQTATLFFQTLSKVYPCNFCALDFREYLKSNPPQTESQEELCQWTCHLHNHVNKKLGKPEFDCSRFRERWGDWGDH